MGEHTKKACLIKKMKFLVLFYSVFTNLLAILFNRFYVVSWNQIWSKYHGISRIGLETFTNWCESSFARFIVQMGATWTALLQSHTRLTITIDVITNSRPLLEQAFLIEHFYTILHAKKILLHICTFGCTHGCTLYRDLDSFLNRLTNLQKREKKSRVN